jgi:hypothetical protein
MAKTITDLSSYTQQKGVIIRTIAAYVGGLGFKSQPDYSSHFMLFSSRQMLHSDLKQAMLVSLHFLLHSSEITIHEHHVILYCLLYELQVCS